MRNLPNNTTKMTIQEITERLLKGETMIYPTDTILGLGCNALDEKAIEKIYSIKHRPETKSLILLVDSPARLQSIVDVPELAWDLIDLNEKPLTIIYDEPRGLPKSLVSKDNTIGIRLTQDPFCCRIIQHIKAPLVSTSVNISGEKAAQVYADISPSILEKVDFVVDEVKTFIPKNEASTIIQLTKDLQVKVIRE